jgi:hypothetical protein
MCFRTQLIGSLCISLALLSSHASALSPRVEASKNPGLKIGEERLEVNEEALTREIRDFSIDLIKSKYTSRPPARRDAHPKTFGVVTAQFIVLDDLPPDLRYGVFKEARTFEAFIRFSAGGDAIKSDRIQERRGMAIKLLGVEGEKLLESERYEKTQDFVLMNFPAFAATNLQDYLDFFKARTAGDEPFKAFLDKHPEIAQRLEEMDQVEVHNPLQAQYWSTTPFKLGPGAMKFTARAISRIGATKPKNPSDNYLREALLNQITKEDVYFEFLIQTQVDPDRMPIENSMVIWDEQLSPYRRVAIIRIPRQDPRAIDDMKLAEELSFTPWHSLPDLRPLGSINRSRKIVYSALSSLRHEMNGVPMREPTSLPRAKHAQ